jgi:hypothetical protein
MSKEDRPDLDDSSHSEASLQEIQKQRDRVRKTRKARTGSSSRRSSEQQIDIVPKKYAPEKYSDSNLTKKTSFSRLVHYY